MQIPKLSVWYLATAGPEQIEWMSLLGPLTRLSVFPRDFVSCTTAWTPGEVTAGADDSRAVA